MTRTSLLTLDAKGRITLPNEILAALEVRPSELILLKRNKRGAFELVAAATVPDDQLWFHHPEMQARVAQAEMDFAEGRSARTGTPAEAQAFLDSLKQRTER
jgi:bifunctional DNA-binding transcriptional regulator/antitoxin component of YhaV-PrlF toxin-antitoxin module